jgi:hypothetical protein
MRHPLTSGLAAVLLGLLGLAAFGQSDFVAHKRFVPLTGFEEYAKSKRVSVHADRKVYWNDDPVGQFLVSFLGEELANRTLKLELYAGGDQPVATHTVGAMKEPKLAVLLRTGALKPGAYKLKAVLDGAAPLTAETAFERADKKAVVTGFPADGIPIEIEPQKALPDAAWPVCMGVPFSQGQVKEVAELALMEDGQEVPAQISLVGTWHPAAPMLPASVRWAHVNFLAKYEKGRPKNYVLQRVSGHMPRTPQPRASVTTAGDLITVDTGVIRFQVNKKSFRGIEAAWLDMNRDRKFTDDEKAISAPTGAYLVDCRSTPFEAADDAQGTVTVEENGPFKVTLAAEGWYTNPKLSDQAGRQLCRYHTRIQAWAGQPLLRVLHRTVLTYDSDTNRLQDLGFRIGAPNGQEWRMGVDGKTLRGKVPVKDASVFLHQYRWDKLRVAGLEIVEKGQKKIGEIAGAKSDGWVTLTPAGNEKGPGLSVCLRDVWQKFPKEMEITPTALVLHFWPKHGTRPFTQEEELAQGNIYKLWFFHQGRLMDLRFPSYAYDRLKDLHTQISWDPESMSEFAVNGNAQGVAVGNEFLIRLHAPEEEAAAAWAALYQQDPHARTDPEWNVRTLVEGRMAARDAETFPEVEKDLDTLNADYLRVVIDGATEYGMWIYADVHNNWDVVNNRAFLHRVWQASHYRNVWTPWMLYFRGGPWSLLRWARPNTDHFMDVGTVNWADPKAPLKAHQPGAMYHCKGFTPWGTSRYGQTVYDSYLGIWGHWVNPDAFLMRWQIEGDGRARELYALWADTFRKSRIPTGPGREVGNTLGEMLNYYRASWDPDMLPLLNDMSDQLLAPKLADWPHGYGFPVFNPFWFARLYDLTRDERVKQRVIEYSETYGKSNAMVMAWCYQQTGDKKYIDASVQGGVYDHARQIYRNPGDPLDGYRSSFSNVGGWYYQGMPYWLQALKDAGMTKIGPASGHSLYPSRASHPQYIPSEAPALELAALNPDGREFTIKLETLPGYDCYNPLVRVIAPSGKVILQHQAVRPKNSRYNGEDIVRIAVPAGEKGLYRVDFRNWENAPFVVPITTLPLEGTIIAPKAPCGSSGRCEVYLAPVGLEGPVTLEWSGDWRYDTSSIGYARVEDATGKLLYETTVLVGSKRPKDRFAIPAGAPWPWRVYTSGGRGPMMEMLGGAKALAASPTPEGARALAAEMEKLK